MESLLFIIVIVIVFNLLNSLLGGKKRKAEDVSSFENRDTAEKEGAPAIFEYPWASEEEDDEKYYLTEEKIRDNEEAAGTKDISDAIPDIADLEDLTKVKRKHRRRKGKRYAFNLLGFTGKDVLQGVIWKEILSEPLSQKPHRRRG